MPQAVALVLACALGAIAVWSALSLGAHGAALPAMVLAGIGAVFAAYYLLFGLTRAAVLVRTLIVLVPVGIGAAGLVLAVLGWQGLDPDVTRALIAAVVVAAGWVVTYMTGEWRRVSLDQERRRDLIRAAITELELIRDHGRRVNWEAAIAEVETAFARQARYDLHIFHGQQYRTLRRLVDQIEVLTWRQIRPVMDAFQALDRLSQMETQMQGDAFRSLPKPRRRDGAVRYLTLLQELPQLADVAVMALRDGPFQGWVRGVQ